ncbi:MAG: DUF3857 domain-containing protein [Flavobacterium sp.]|nr:DUF3857 domain-containing protein [Pedobacter sp.]
MKKSILIFLFFCVIVFAKAQNKYEIAKINPQLLVNADAVVRLDDINFEVKSTGKATEKLHYAVTILNKNGDHFSSFYSAYDKFSSVVQLKVIVYNKMGVKIKDFNKNDFSDKSLISDYSIFEENRLKSLKIYETNYPYTVEFFSVVDYNGILTYPAWNSLGYYNVAVENSTYQISIPSNQTLRYQESPLTKVKEETIDNRKFYSWQAQNVKAFKLEPLSVGISRLVPWAKLAPNEFEYDNSKGNLKTWDLMGKWISELNQEGDILNPASVLKIKNLTEGVTSTRKKIELLYSYMQNNTRYVSVQLGIGGFKPILASKVAEVNYGDCKALSNYMKALLKQAGIHSELVVIKNEDSLNGSLIEGFPSIGQANHMILCVPELKDTVWLECTNQQMPFGFIGGSNSNRNVLLISQNGGKIARTPLYSVSDNTQNRICDVTINTDGNAVAKIVTDYTYEQFENNYAQLFKEPKEQRDFLLESLQIANPEITSFTYSQPDKAKPKLIEEIHLKVNNLFANGGDKLFLTLNMMNKRNYVPELSETRLTDFALTMNYTDVDHINYKLPADFKVEFLPKDMNLKSDFGEYSLKISLTDGGISYIRTQKMYRKEYPAKRFQELVDFYKSIYKADKQKAVITKI